MLEMYVKHEASKVFFVEISSSGCIYHGSTLFFSATLPVSLHWYSESILDASGAFLMGD